MTPEEFVKTYLPFALEIQETWGVPVSLSLSQSALETGWGKNIPEGSNNLFGIKTSDGYPSMTYKTSEDDGSGNLYKTSAGFNIYSSPSEAFEHYAKVLHKDHFMDKGWKWLDSITAIEKIQTGGYKYATDSEYVTKISSIIEGYGLQSFDGVNKESSTPIPDTEEELTWQDWLNPKKHWESITKVWKYPLTKDAYEYVQENAEKGSKPAQILEPVLGGWDSAKKILEDPLNNIVRPIVGVGAILFLVVVVIVLAIMMIKGGSAE